MTKIETHDKIKNKINKENDQVMLDILLNICFKKINKQTNKREREILHALVILFLLYMK